MSWSWETQYPDKVQDLIRFSKLIYDRNLVSAAGGNISIRCGKHILITGSNVSLREVTPDSLVLCDLQGKMLEAPQGLRPSKETQFHLGIYTQRPEINCVIHAHPAFSVIWSLQGTPLPLYTESARLKLRTVPLIPAAPPGSSELARQVIQAVARAPETIRAFLMENHGILVMGETAKACFHQSELLEDSAKIAVFHALLNI